MAIDLTQASGPLSNAGALIGSSAPTWDPDGSTTALPAPSTIGGSGRNKDRLNLIFLETALAADMADYDPATLYTAVLNGTNDAATTIPTDTGLQSWSHLTFGDSPDVSTVAPDTSMFSAYVPNLAGSNDASEDMQALSPTPNAQPGWDKRTGGLSNDDKQNPGKVTFNIAMTPSFGKWSTNT